MLDDSMISIIQADFDVRLLAASDQSALFAALRPGGTKNTNTSDGEGETYVMGIWHFIVLSSNEMTYQMTQWHIPRYEMAAALKIQDQFNKSDSYTHPSFASYMPLPTHIHGRNKLELLLGEEGEGFLLPEDFVWELKKDIPLLEGAIEQIIETDEIYRIPDIKTHAGNPVESKSYDILGAIAFEKATYPEVTAGNFGIYSAYCTDHDFGISTQMPDSLIRQLLTEQFEYTAEDISDEMHDLFLNTQNQLLSKPIWGRDIKMSLEEAAPILADGMARLTRTQRTQFILMNGMHAQGLFLPLSCILGTCDFGAYAYYVCEGFQPDSLEEQERRAQSSYIELYGKLAQSLS
jgi:hypothetical protein